MKYGFAGVSVTASSFDRWVAGSADSNVMLASGSAFMLNASSVTLAGGSTLMWFSCIFFSGVCKDSKVAAKGMAENYMEKWCLES